MTVFSVICYAIVAVSYTVLGVLLITSWRGRRVGGSLIAACLVSAVWAMTMVAQTSLPSIPAIAIFVAEVLRGGAWLIFLALLAAQIGVNRRILSIVHFVWIGVLIAGIAVWSLPDVLGRGLNLAEILFNGGLVISFCGLLLIEQLYRNSPPEAKWGVKALSLGIGGMFAYDLFLYSQGVLLGSLDATTWAARSAANILFVPMIAIATKRNPDWDLNLFVSRQVVFYTTSLIAVGLYLLVMSLGGYALVLYGGTWGGLAQTVFFVGAILVLVILLFSATLRARFKVFLSKHFFHNKYDYREEWLRLISTLADFDDSSTREIVVKAMAQIVDSPFGLLWAQQDAQAPYKLVATYGSANVNFDIAMDDPLVDFIREQSWLVDLEEIDADPELYGGLVLPEWLGEIPDAWLVVPVITRQQLIGLVLLGKAPGPPALNYEDRDLLKTVGCHIAVHLAQENSDILLAEAQQFEAYNRLTAFLMHDLNNLIAQQSLIVKNAERHKRNPEFVDDAMRTISNSVERMKRVMDQLKRGDGQQMTKKTPLKFVVSTAVDRCAGHLPVPQLKLNGVDSSLKVDQERLSMVLAHLIKNAQDATPGDGTIDVQLLHRGSDIAVEISDSGSGMAPEFVRDRLFRPFDSTKGSQGMGIGAYQAREFARRMGGDLLVESELGKGTTVTMVLPLNQ